MSPTINSLQQLDDFWRECLRSGHFDQSKYADLLKKLHGQVSHLPQEEQDEFFRPFVVRNAEYIAIAKRDKDALKVRLGVPASSAAAGLDPSDYISDQAEQLFNDAEAKGITEDQLETAVGDVEEYLREAYTKIEDPDLGFHDPD